MRALPFVIAVLAVQTACGREEVAGEAEAAHLPGPPSELTCTPSPRMALEGRASPYDSVAFQVDGTAVKICYGRPSARGRTMIGGEAVPYDRVWRTGANEPTILHTAGALSIAGVEVPAGSYSIYTIPTAGDWTIIVNRSTSQWGHESQYTDEIRAQDAGRGTAQSERLDEHVETFTIRTEPRAAGGVELLLEWEHTRVRVPVSSGG